MNNQEIGEYLVRIDERQIALSDDVKEINKILKGNGQPGLVSRMDKSEASLKTAKWFVGIGLTVCGLFIAWLSVK